MTDWLHVYLIAANVATFTILGVIVFALGWMVRPR
jgi:hypothetical protein